MEIPRKSTGVLYEQNHGKKMKYKHTVDTAVDPMPIDEISINIWFICTILVAQTVPTGPLSWSKKGVFDLWTVVWDRNIKLSIEV